uniref:hypothetical protein n=1 Tax=Flavobacterium sp. TaxID=239 RepID=UPI00404A0CC9
MTQFKNKPQTSDQNFNYNRFDFNVIFEKSFELYKKVFAQTGIVILLFSIIQILVASSIQYFFYGFSVFTTTTTEFDFSNYSTLTLLGATLASATLVGFTSPMLASVFGMCQHYITHKTQPPISAFDYYQNPIFGKIFAYSFGMQAFNELIVLLFDRLSIDFVAYVIIVPINLLLIVTIPILLFRKLDIAKSINLSLKITTKQPFLILLLLIVACLFAIAGIFALCIGIIFTIPIYYIVIYRIYEHQFPINDESIIDEIGFE